MVDQPLLAKESKAVLPRSGIDGYETTSAVSSIAQVESCEPNGMLVSVYRAASMSVYYLKFSIFTGKPTCMGAGVFIFCILFNASSCLLSSSFRLAAVIWDFASDSSVDGVAFEELLA